MRCDPLWPIRRSPCLGPQFVTGITWTLGNQQNKSGSMEFWQVKLCFFFTILARFFSKPNTFLSLILCQTPQFWHFPMPRPQFRHHTISHPRWGTTGRAIPCSGKDKNTTRLTSNRWYQQADKRGDLLRQTTELWGLILSDLYPFGRKPTSLSSQKESNSPLGVLISSYQLLPVSTWIIGIMTWTRCLKLQPWASSCVFFYHLCCKTPLGRFAWLLWKSHAFHGSNFWYPHRINHLTMELQWRFQHLDHHTGELVNGDVKESPWPAFAISSHQRHNAIDVVEVPGVWRLQRLLFLWRTLNHSPCLFLSFHIQNSVAFFGNERQNDKKTNFCKHRPWSWPWHTILPSFRFSGTNGLNAAVMALEMDPATSGQATSWPLSSKAEPVPSNPRKNRFLFWTKYCAARSMLIWCLTRPFRGPPCFPGFLYRFFVCGPANIFTRNLPWRRRPGLLHPVFFLLLRLHTFLLLSFNTSFDKCICVFSCTISRSFFCGTLK